MLAACLVVLWATPVWALGTSAGTPIVNTATVDYTLGADPTPLSSTAPDSTFYVQEVVDVVVTWQDVTHVPVNSPHAAAILTFLITNTGNGTEDMDLFPNAGLTGDNFDPILQDIYLESNGTPGWQATDTLYGGSISLAADDAVTVYVRSDIPGLLADASTGDFQLVARALTLGAAGSPAGTVLSGRGTGGVDAIVGTTNADGEVTGTYEVTAAAVALTKSIVQIVDPYGGNQPYTSARVTYRIVVDVTGFGTAEALVITDLIPADMTYLTGTMVLDGVPQTDGADADSGDFNSTNVNTVTVTLGDIVAPATYTIEFNTTIN